jgi:signal transduction histidine kinase
MNPDPASLTHLRHELRTPLNHILGYSEMLLEDAGEAGELPAELQRIRGEGQALLAVVENALAPARMERGGPDLGRLASALSGPLGGLAETVDRLARLASEGDAGTVAADVERIAGAVARLRALRVSRPAWLHRLRGDCRA